MSFADELRKINEGLRTGNSILTSLNSTPERVAEPPAPSVSEGIFENPFKPPTQILTPSYVPVIENSILEGNAELETELIFSYVKTGTGVLRNVVAEMATESGDEKLVEDFESGKIQMSDEVKSAQKRVEQKKNILADEGLEDTDVIRKFVKTVILEDLKKKAREGKYRLPSKSSMIRDLVIMMSSSLIAHHPEALSNFTVKVFRKIKEKIT
ncbi:MULTISPECIES: hypothetical protein [Flectobacillus]|uniref:Uncharacterized protein n=2 Tax=Flectobacillus TaxID=101 RepID=A0ABT6Z1K9_9BACT|nr:MULTISPECIES: hypothetical protein [Flectobacillus]MDI9863476.1 hypothetical protein [Flectobacillus longus]MDI9872161.1 hypothetical protein [Flectobacillus roseus]MDI9874988.1 hypothetical protein [Flectobacillus rivi]